MSEQQVYDVIVIGGGPAGVTAALRARELGARTALVERGRLGGTCTNDGCAPTRVLAKAARLYRDALQLAEYGLDAPIPQLDFPRLLARTQQVVYQLHEKKQLIDHLQSAGADTFYGVGNAAFDSPHNLRLGDGRTLYGQRFIICAGGSGKKPPFPGGNLALTHSDVWTLTHLPASVIIIGAGATGCQLASIFNTFGTRTIIMDIAPRLLMSEDAEVAAALAGAFRDEGIETLTGIGGISGIEKRPDGRLDVLYKEGDQIMRRDVDMVIAAVGWAGNLPALNLEAAGVAVQGSYIQVDDQMQTSAAHIYAAGDITGKIMLVQTASQQARIAVENALLDRKQSYIPALVPHGGFTDPEYGSVGMTEAQAHAAFGAEHVISAVAQFAEIDRAVIDGRTGGFCKLLVNRATHEVIGAHVVGEQAVEVVHIVAASMVEGVRVEALAGLEFAYPTFAAVVGVAAKEIISALRTTPVIAQWRELGKKRLVGAQ